MSEKSFKSPLEDTDTGVRESAIWAFAFVGGNIKKLAVEVRKNEQDENVLEFPARVESCSLSKLWFV